MGVGASHQSKLEREIGGLGDGEGEERFFGLENFGNTCYCNSVLQALYFCEPLRHHLSKIKEEDEQAARSGGVKASVEKSGPGLGGIEHAADDNSSSILSQLAELFSSISKQKQRSGRLAPTEFLRTLRERNELFRGNMQQDAHEFFNFVLNEMADGLIAREKRKEAAAVAKNKRLQPSGVQQRQSSAQLPNQQHQQRRSSTRSKLSNLKGTLGNGSKAGSASPAAMDGMKTGSDDGVTDVAPKAGGGSGKRGASLPQAAPERGESDRDGERGLRQKPAGSSGNGSSDTWVHRIFQGTLTNQTKCLCCETVSNRDEPFMDLSLDVEQNSSVSACLRSFSSTETLTKKNKFFCENCNALQEAEKKIRLKHLPRVLTLHLKRFKYVESLDSFSKLSHRVVFPLELRAPNMADGPAEADADGRLYRLFAVVVHIGRGPNNGHYIALVKSGGRWLLFDDEVVNLVNEQMLRQCFGLARPASQAVNTGYLLLYDCGEES